MAVEWSYYDTQKVDEINGKYLPDYGEGETMATQVVTAVNKLIYKWYNDGDVYDNVHSGMNGWANDLSSYANWLAKYLDYRVREILDGIKECHNDSDYEDLLKRLADLTLDEQFLNMYAETPKVGSVYECDGWFEFNDDWDSEDDDEDWEDEDDEDDEWV